MNVLCDKLVRDIYGSAKNNPLNDKTLFFVGNYDIRNDDGTLIPMDNLYKKLLEISIGYNSGASKYVNHDVLISDIITILYTTDANGIYIGIFSKKNVINSAIASFLNEKFSNKIVTKTNESIVCKDVFMTELFLSTQDCPNQKPMIDMDLVKQYTCRYFINEGLITLDPEEDELIFDL